MTSKNSIWPYLKAEIPVADLASLRLTSGVTSGDSVMATYGDVALFFRKEDIARLLFGGRRRRRQRA